ncbi:MAG: GNAT family N-acetyltransferase [Magnetococcales bacterium]|nr:GNAT family N-acetyltransferase [Magnetococcales bacterium]
MLAEFSEKYFFLKAFHGLTLTLVLSRESDPRPETVHALAGVLQDLSAHRVKALFLVQESRQTHDFLHALDERLHHACHQLATFRPDEIPVALWRRSAMWTSLGFATLETPVFLEQVARLGCALRLPRVLLIDQTGGAGWRDENGLRPGFVNAHRLRKLPETPENRLFLPAIRALLAGGVGAVTLCRLQDLETELFSYEGAGIFFARRHYCQVRRLTLDDYSQAAAMIRRGEKEGFLLPRSDEDVTALLTQGYGAFISEHHLAGVCGLVTAPYREENGGEITALYALTRFHGEGVGARMVTRIVQEARRGGLRALFACVGDRRAVEFFGHHGFRTVAHSALPDAKWRHYDPARKSRITCLLKDLPPLAGG